MKKIIPLFVFIGLTMNANAKVTNEIHSLDDIRNGINDIDAKIILLMKERQTLVKGAAAFKKDEVAVRDDARVEAVIQKVVTLATETGLDPVVAENTYRAMIASFINLELKEHKKNM